MAVVIVELLCLLALAVGIGLWVAPGAGLALAGALGIVAVEMRERAS